MNTLCLHLIKSILQLINTNIKTIKHDFQFHVVPFDLFSCQFVGYIFFSIVNALYWSCFLHAAYRFTRVLYPKCLWLHRLSTYIYILIPGQVFIAFAGMAPLLWIFKSIDLISGEIYCSLLMEELISLVYFFSMLFCLPFGLIVMCYIYLIYKIRCLKWIRSVTQRNRRDYIVIRRILTILCVLSITSLPTVINLMFFNPNSKIDPFIYRLQLGSRKSAMFR
ncbi:hypothetical protein I4U23_012197 [Adineta vaga]|nr:hypothetical protein I4U23_012197 [Adineta vaga]